MTTETTHCPPSRWQTFWEGKKADLARDGLCAHIDHVRNEVRVRDIHTGDLVDRFTPKHNAIVIEARLIAVVLDRLEHAV